MESLMPLTDALRRGESLSFSSAEAAAHRLVGTDEPLESKKAFLDALHVKGESVTEVTALAQVFRGLARDPDLGPVADRAIDVVGTGGSASGGYNISSATAVTVAACGVPVLKHGNRAITSRSGAADFLSVLGLPIQEDPAILRQSVDALNFCFLFAPAFHPAFKEIIPVRKALAEEKKRTIFNILGALLNPARPKYQLLGVYSEEWVKPLADALTGLGLARGLAASCLLDDGRRMDELTTAGTNAVAGAGLLQDLHEHWSAVDFGFEPADPDEIRGGSPEENVKAFEAIIEGKGSVGLRDTIAFNAGVALFIAEAVDEVTSGVQQAREALSGGGVKAWLTEAREFYRGVS